MRYCLVPFGCQMNVSDSERIRSVLESLGYVRTEIEEEADLLGIVACSVRQKAIDKVYTRIHKWNQWKSQRPLTTLLSGCVLPADHEKFADRFDVILSINDLPRLPTMLRQHGVVTPVSLQVAERNRAESDERNDYWRITPSYSSSFEAYIPIQNGCDKFCTFCAVPYTRGREVSRSSSEILDEVRDLVNSGYRSLTLLGQNVNSYGLDRSGMEMPFANLLRNIGEIGREMDQRFWVYFTSPHPKDMTDEVIDVISQYDCIAEQVHLPIQSGDDKLLLRMKRNHTVEQYRRTVHKIRNTIPKATLFTDIIVGFSGETEEQFAHTRDAMREFQYNMAYIAMYSPRPGAVSARWEDDVPQEEKRRRLHLLSQDLQVMSGAYNQRLVGTEVTVLVEGPDRKSGWLTAKTEGRLILRFPSADESLVGQFATVRIAETAALSMEGTLIRVEDGRSH